MKNIVESIKLNQLTVEKWMLSQAVEELPNLYVSMPKGTVHKVVQKQIEVIYMTHGEDNKDVRHFVQHLKNVYLEMLKSLCLHLLTLLRYFLELNKEKSNL